MSLQLWILMALFLLFQTFSNKYRSINIEEYREWIKNSYSSVVSTLPKIIQKELIDKE
jgi:predicted DNA-binding protein (MmcQ/YjbR family)